MIVCVHSFTLSIHFILFRVMEDPDCRMLQVCEGYPLNECTQWCLSYTLGHFNVASPPGIALQGQENVVNHPHCSRIPLFDPDLRLLSVSEMHMFFPFHVGFFHILKLALTFQKLPVGAKVCMNHCNGLGSHSGCILFSHPVFQGWALAQHRPQSLSDLGLRKGLTVD